MNDLRFLLMRLRIMSRSFFVACSLFVVGSAAVSCSNDTESEPFFQESKETRSLEDPAIDAVRSEYAKLVRLAGEKLEKTQEEARNAKVSCIMSDDGLQRSSLSPDTLGYIVNYPESSGFVIMANECRSNQILAYSPEASFPLDDNPVRELIVNSIRNYLESEGGVGVSVAQAGLNYSGKLVRHSVEPVVRTKLDQSHPYNYYVRVNLGWPYAGCVPVAAATIVCHTEKTLVYHNYKYYFPDVVKYLEQGPGTFPGSTKIVPQDPYLLSFPKTYDGSAMAVARLLYDFGQDMDIDYSMKWAGGYGIDARRVLRSIGCITTDAMAKFKMLDVLDYLEDGWLIFVEGDRVPNNGYGHAWVIDGSEYYTTGITNEIYSCYFHCDWGWGGDYNGYYSGEIFSPSEERSYTLADFFPVKIKK